MSIIQFSYSTPEAELQQISELLYSLGKTIANKKIGENAPVQIIMPNIAKQVISYAYKEIKEEMADRESKGYNDVVVVPSWLFNTNAPGVCRSTVKMNREKYDEMINAIRVLYPDIYANPKISNNDFIAALGIAYAHRIMAGNRSVTVSDK